jgi:Kdo2-lipid IVA lauroyltransferase/acyltransferase
MAKRKRKSRPQPKKYAPQYWPTWLLIGLAWGIARLPLSWVFAMGESLGRLTYRLGKSRRLVTETNIARCFPELSLEDQQTLVRKVFAAVGIGALELMIPWLNPNRDLSDRFDITGKEHLDAAVAEGRGVVLVGGHYAVMDAISQPLGDMGYIDVMYRYNKNPVWEWLQVTGRKRYFDGVIEREDTRQTLRRLKQGRVIWYAADQDYGRNHSVFARFFGIPAATIVATSRFARLNNSPVLLMRQTRDTKHRRWHIHFSPVVENFPSGDDQVDAERMNALLEADIRLHPEQYLWLHKRFKTRPEGEPKFYPEGC